MYQGNDDFERTYYNIMEIYQKLPINEISNYLQGDIIWKN